MTGLGESSAKDLRICDFRIIIKFANLLFADWHTQETRNLQIHDGGMSIKTLRICDLQT
jgi:prepilin-type processing-associated H-X9-DG protein